MPYIKQTDREALSLDETPWTQGELNYLITQLLITYINENGGLNYEKINDVMGALEGAKLEFYRRIAAPYEDTKIEQNGDVYDELLREAGLV